MSGSSLPLLESCFNASPHVSYFSLFDACACTNKYWQIRMALWRQKNHRWTMTCCTKTRATMRLLSTPFARGQQQVRGYHTFGRSLVMVSYLQRMHRRSWLGFRASDHARGRTTLDQEPKSGRLCCITIFIHTTVLQKASIYPVLSVAIPFRDCRSHSRCDVKQSRCSLKSTCSGLKGR